MKVCPGCKKQYDDSWSVCFKCTMPLESLSASEYAAGFEETVVRELGALRERVSALERAAGVVRAGTDAPLEAPRAASAPAAGAAPARPAPAKAGTDIESAIGLVWFNRIGVVALLFGAAFFLKYAFDNRWIGEIGRIVMGVTAGLGLLLGAEAARGKKQDTMSQGLHGAGVGILYLSVYAAFGLYKLIGIAPAFALMTLVTVYGCFWSVRTNWPSAAVIGTCGGFMTLVLMGSNKLEPWTLFGYIAMLDLGVLGISLYKNWRALNLLSFLFSHVMFLSWLGAAQAREHWVSAAVFSVLLFGIYCLLSIAHNLFRRRASDTTDVLLIAANGLAAFTELLVILKPHAGGFPGLLPLALSAVYLAYSYSAMRRNAGDKGLVLAYAGMTVVFVTIAIPVQLGKYLVAAAWGLEALLLYWLSFRVGLPKLRIAASVVGLLSLLRLFSYDNTGYGSVYALAKYPVLSSSPFISCAIVIACIVAAAVLYRRHAREVSTEERVMGTLLFLLANFLAVWRLSFEAQVFFAHLAQNASVARYGQEADYNRFFGEWRELFGARQMTLSALWILYALGAVAAGIYRRFRSLRLFALCLFGLAIAKIFLVDLSQLDRIYRIVSFLCLGVVMMTTSFFYQRYKDRIHEFAFKD